MSEDWTIPERREMMRRLLYALETHPTLSGMMTDDHKFWLRDLVHSGLRRNRQPKKGEDPDYVIELGYDEIEDDDYPKRTVHEALPQVEAD